MNDILLFLKSKRFRIHFIISILFGCIILWFAFKLLGIYTHHGEKIAVPDFSNVKTEELKNFISEKKLNYEVIDSVYEPKVTAGVVVKQDPEKNSFVKQNRTIYLTVSSKLPPLIKMPNLVDASMRQAQAVIESYGLEMGAREYRADPCVNCVLEQKIKGKKIQAGEMIPKGSVVDLVLGKGQDGEKISVPCLSGLTKDEASDKIAESGLSAGSITCTDCRTSAEKGKAKVYKQIPACSSDLVNPGTSVDLFLTIKGKTDE